MTALYILSLDSFTRMSSSDKSDLLAVNVTYHLKNETVVLPCEQLSDYPIIWYGPPNLSTYAIGKDINQNLSKSDRLFIVHTTGFSQHNLKIRYFSIDDRGLYKCVRRGPYNKVQEIFFELEMTKAPRNLTIENEDSNNIVYGYLNKPFNLTCNVIEGIPKGKLVWIANNKTVTEAAASSLVYFLRPQQNDHLKLLSCATVSYKTVPPDVWISPNHNMYILNEGDDLSIYCNYISNHDITELKWGKSLTMNSQFEHIQSSANLSIQNIKSENAGQYVCTVSNMAGNDSETVSIEVHLPPDVWISPNHSMYILNEGDDLSIYCNYISNHDITELKWGKSLPMNSQLEHIQSSANLTIQNIKSENAGHYVCTVSNMAGNDSETVSIEVHLLPNVWISPDHNDVILDEGDDLTLYCNYSSNHNITNLKWNRLLPMESQLWTSQSSPALFIRNIQIAHAGQYVCTVSNMAGNGFDNVTIKVNSQLKAPQNIMAVAFSDRIIVKWTSDLDIGLQETFVVEYRKHVESSWSQVSVEDRYTAVINGLVADTVYLVRVYSRTASRKSDRTDNIIVKTGNV
ncbi:HMCN [Mytilus coruscus]|uniref:HMCN n=1 Tax=Mytilus coruscus TaxID=42192 RepID=A0A6J8AHY3_MYTCO|nr:HMCN [Mytilus coruscus]